MITKRDAFSLYQELKINAISTGTVDDKCLNTLLERIVAELKKEKTSAFVDKLYTACMQYACFPSHNKKTMPEIRVKPTSMGMSGTDAMLLLELVSMKIQTADVEKTSSFKLASSRLFSSYTIKPASVKRKLDNNLERINVCLRQQGALAHFGNAAHENSDYDEPLETEITENEKTEANKALSLYDELKAGVIETGIADEDCLSEFLDTTLEELRLKKASSVIDKLYTACMQYTAFPEHNKVTLSEIRVRPVSMGVSGTDAMLLLEMLSMKIDNKNCEKTDAFITARNRLFSSYVIKPSAVKSKLGTMLEKMNNKLCQQGALAHFGGAMERPHAVSGTTSKKQNATKKTTPVKSNTKTNILEKTKELFKKSQKQSDKKSTKANIKPKKAVSSKKPEVKKPEVKKPEVKKPEVKKPEVKKPEVKKPEVKKPEVKKPTVFEGSSHPTVTAEKEAATIIERAKARERILSAGADPEISKCMTSILSSINEANKNALALQEKLENTYIEKFTRDLLEIYNLMSDNRESLKDDEKNRNNICAYMDMIEDILAKYGITAIHSKNADAFSGKIHEAVNTRDFDPKESTVEKSIRTGFKRGDVVIQKEKIELNH